MESGWQRVFIPKADSERIPVRRHTSIGNLCSGPRREDGSNVGRGLPKSAQGPSRQRATRKTKWDKNVKTLYIKKKFNILMVADQIKNDEFDRRFVDTCIVLCQEGHNVTILSTRIMTSQCFEIRHYCRKIFEVGRWIPRDFCGVMRAFCYYVRSAYLALYAYFYVKPKPDLIFCHCLNATAMKLFRWIDCKLLAFFQVFSQNQIPRNAQEYRIQPRYTHQQDMNFVDEVLASNQLAQYIFKYTYKASEVPITVLYPSIRQPYRECLNYRPPLIIPEKSYTFLSIHNLVPSSRFEITIKAFGIMYSSLDDSIRDRCYLILVGHFMKNKKNERYIQGLKNLILCMNMQDRIFILNNVQHNFQRHLLSLCHAYIHAQNNSVCEDNIIEAMAFGRPIIATNKGFPCEVITHKETGYLLPLDEDLFADAMIDLLLHTEKYKKMCLNVQSVYQQNFSFPTFMKTINRVIGKFDDNVLNDMQSGSQDVSDLNNALEEIHKNPGKLPSINVLATHQELVTDKFYTNDKFYEDVPAVEDHVDTSMKNLMEQYYT